MRYHVVIGPKGRILAAAPVSIKPEQGTVTFSGFGDESKATIREVDIADQEAGTGAANLYKRLREAVAKKPSKARR
jgi:hypothetical protein